MAPKLMTLRVQSPDGTKRIELSLNDTLANLYSKVRQEFGLDANGWQLYRDKRRQDILKAGATALLNAKLTHGDIIYLHFNNGISAQFAADSLIPAEQLSSIGTSHASTEEHYRRLAKPIDGREDDVDIFLAQLDGKIDRPKDPNLCHHGHHSKCVHCFPIDPFDEAYLLKRDIKHMSFNAYLRQIESFKGKGSTTHSLENISCAIKPGCNSHLPWPEGICTKCQPSAVTLNRQRYRHVDNISFENEYLVQRFLDFWRRSGSQRLGFLYGRYEAHLDVPLGIKAVVAAIYEPPQVGTAHSLHLLDDPQEPVVNQLAAQLGLRRVGWIFTDLVAEGQGTVKYSRHADSYFLSGEECITAAWLQNQHPNHCRLAADGWFGSKFVTVLVTGDKNNQVHFEGYQVSNQCVALVRDRCLVPTHDAPELAYVKESTAKQYVPDVYFKEKDQYGNEVTKPGRPLPVEYLIVDVPAGMPVEPQFTFAASSKIKPFPPANRADINEPQSFDALAAYCSQFSKNQFYEMVTDFHFLLFLLTNSTYTFTAAQLAPLFAAVREKDRGKAYDWHKEESWATLEQLLLAHGTSVAAPMDIGDNEQATAGAGQTQAQWACSHCTYHNSAARQDCEMCGLPRS